MIVCCNGCPDRHMGCHSVCIKYIKEKEQHDIEMEVVRRTIYNYNEAESVASYGAGATWNTKRRRYKEHLRSNSGH